MTRELLDYTVRALIDYPEEMEIREIEEDGMTVYQLHVSPRDIGKVIGRRGRVARALRTLLKVSSIHNHTRATLEID